MQQTKQPFWKKNWNSVGYLTLSFSFSFLDSDQNSLAVSIRFFFFLQQIKVIRDHYVCGNYIDTFTLLEKQKRNDNKGVCVSVCTCMCRMGECASLAVCRGSRNETMQAYSFISWQQHSGPWVRCVKLFLKEAAYIIEVHWRAPRWSCQAAFISKAQPFVIKFKLTLCTLNLNFRAPLSYSG